MSEISCMYAALLCKDSGVEVTAANIEAACKAAKAPVSKSAPAVFAALFEKVDVEDLLSNLSVGGGGAAPAGGAPAAAAEAAPAAAAPAPVEESDEDMGDFGLFD
eukprot:TRINITY_DN2183_c0_g3_i8.p3 TRINITY_DN2183_c0_g3~~TRINITY_DN2183_c0_g3_i8.p3  ORF type:complete len:105 (+),score=52.63 TRINITY_DN2183_c0_g3_i8:67-381(+)